MIRLEPVRDKDDNLLLFDIFVGEQWHGSRRTYEQCLDYLRSIFSEEELLAALG